MVRSKEKMNGKGIAQEEGGHFSEGCIGRCDESERMSEEEGREGKGKERRGEGEEREEGKREEVECWGRA